MSTFLVTTEEYTDLNTSRYQYTRKFRTGNQERSHIVPVTYVRHYTAQRITLDLPHTWCLPI